MTDGLLSSQDMPELSNDYRVVIFGAGGIKLLIAKLLCSTLALNSETENSYELTLTEINFET